MLQFYAFLLVLAVSLQLSMSLVFILDDGVLRTSYVQSVTIAGKDVCGTADAMPYGAGYLPIDAICTCFVTQAGAESELSGRLTADLHLVRTATFAMTRYPPLHFLY